MGLPFKRLNGNNYVVYKHTSPSGKCYIGITSQNPERRWRNGNGYADNTYFCNAIKKYGWDNFKHEIINSNLSIRDACKKEIELINYYKTTNPLYGYNISSGGEGGTGLSGELNGMFGRKGELAPWYGKKHTEETKQKIRDSHKGVPKSKEAIKNMNLAKGVRGIVQLDLLGNYIKSHISMNQAAIATNTNQSDIWYCCHHKRKSAHSFQWFFEDEYRNQSEATVYSKNVYNKRKVDMYDFYGNFIKTYECITYAAIENNCSDGEISNCCSGKRHYVKKVVFRYHGENYNKYDVKLKTKSVACLDDSYNIIKLYESITQASKIFGIDIGTVSKACKKENHKAKGYIWMFYEDYIAQYGEINTQKTA